MNVPDKKILNPVVECVMLLGCGITAVVEGLRLERHYRPKGVYDRIGAGNFLLAIGIALLLVTCVYAFSELKKYRAMPDSPRVSESHDEKSRTKAVIGAVGLVALNIFLIPILGYLVPTTIFFILSFTIFKLTESQPLNALLGVCVGIAFFLIFSHALGMSFPTGYFGLDFGVK